MTNLVNGEIRLRAFNYEDISKLAKLANNKNISCNLRDAFPCPYSEKNAEDFIAMSFKDQPQRIFAIEYKGEYVGTIGLHAEHDVYRKSAEIGYFIGEPYWGKGITTTAVNLVCEYGFKKLDIVRIHTGVFEFNHASQRVLEKCGFVKEGVFRKAIIKNGELYDEIRYALIV
jgi:RimJ/RimL family protein N-acetyltransferase